MGLEDALPRVLLPPVVVVVLRVHHPSHSVVGGADGAKSENTSTYNIVTFSLLQNSHFYTFLSVVFKTSLSLLVSIKSKNIRNKSRFSSPSADKKKMNKKNEEKAP